MNLGGGQFGGMLFQGAFMLGEDWKTGLVWGKPLRGLRQAARWNLRGTAPFLLAGGALAAATAPRGQALSSAASTSGIVLGSLIGGALFGVPGMIAGQMLGEHALGRPIGRAVQAVHDLGSNLRRLEMGGSYRDSAAAYTMRQVAVQEMGRSLLNARSILGREAAFMHT